MATESASLASALMATTPATATLSSGVLFNDTSGAPLHAHGLGILPPSGHPLQPDTYYMVGTTKKLPPSWLSTGVNLYSSTDLQHWKFLRTIFNVSSVLPASAKRIERPKILWNEATKKYVMWWHMDDASFSLGYVGVATCDTIDGAYKFVAGWRPDGLRSLDMTIFVDTGSSSSSGGSSSSSSNTTIEPVAYLVRSVDNQYTGFSRLTPDFLNTTSDGIVSRGPKCEGNAVWKEQQRWFMMCSHLTGWHANPAILARSNQSDLVGASWSALGNPTKKGYSYDSQPTYVLPLALPQGRLLIYMGDRWNEASESAPGSVGGASYVWLPLLHNKSDVTGFSMPLLHGKWNGTGTWRVADYLEPY